MPLLLQRPQPKSTTSTDDSAVTTAADHSAVTTSVSLDEEDTVETWDDSAAVKVTLNDSSASFTGKVFLRPAASQPSPRAERMSFPVHTQEGSLSIQLPGNSTHHSQRCRDYIFPTTVPLK